MSVNSQKLIPLLLAVAMVISPTLSFSAGGGTSQSTGNEAKSQSSRYTTSTISRFDEAKNLIALKQFSSAYSFLEGLQKKESDEADRQNLLGFTARKDGKLDRAASHYEKALQINPNHKGALEYQGELYLTLGQAAKAKDNLMILRSLCPIECLELKLLEAAIENF